MLYILTHVVPLALPVALLVSLAVHAAWLLGHRHPRPTLRLAQRGHIHLGVAGLAWLAAAALAILLTARSFGALPGHLPQRHLGGIAPPAYSLERWAPPIYDQGNTNSCGPHAVNEAVLMRENIRGEQRPYAQSSPWWTYLHTPGGPSNGYTSFAQDVAAIQSYGLISLAAMPSLNSVAWSVRATAVGGYGYQLALDPAQVALAISQGRPVVLLTRVNSDFYGAWGASSTCNFGGYEGMHFVLAIGYQYEADGYHLLIQNSWGTTWGSNGRIWLCPRAFQFIIEADVYAPGAPAWPLASALQPTATPQARPAPTRRPVARPTPRPVPRPTASPTARPGASGWLITHDTVLRAGPRDFPRTRYLLRARIHVTRRYRDTPHWVAIVYHGHQGYAWRAYVKRATKGIR